MPVIEVMSVLESSLGNSSKRRHQRGGEPDNDDVSSGSVSLKLDKLID